MLTALFAVLALALILAPAKRALADTTANQVKEIDYDELTITFNGSESFFYSEKEIDADSEDWKELFGEYVTVDGTSYLRADISWVAATSDKTIYFKDGSGKVFSVDFPKKNSSVKVKFDKATGEVDITGADEAKSFQWRKKTDYTWHTVSLEETEEAKAQYDNFLKDLDALRIKAASLIVRIPQVKGTSENSVGQRPSKECTVSIAKRANAPSLKINMKKFTVNTTAKMEYYVESTRKWESCEKAMTVEDLFGKVGPEATTDSVTVKVRTAATEKKPYSKTATITLETSKKTPDPTVGDAKQDAYYVLSKNTVLLTMTKATSSVPYEYTIVSAGETLDYYGAKWKTVKKRTAIKIAESKCSAGDTIYVRVKGVAGNTKKGITAKMPSAATALKVEAAK